MSTYATVQMQHISVSVISRVTQFSLHHSSVFVSVHSLFDLAGEFIFLFSLAAASVTLFSGSVTEMRQY